MLVPCVICALKLDSTTNSELTEMEAGFEMRNHLIAEHSTYVAKSFLEPESTSNVHFWLCTNVLHEGPPTPVDVSSLLVNLLKTPSPNENLHSLFRHEDDEPKSTFNLKDYMDIKVDFSRKEPGKLANNNDYIASDLITTFARVAKESNNFDPMAIVSSFDLGIVRENGGRSVDEHPALPPPEGIDLKDDRICHLCWEDSRYPGRHIAQRHLKKALYECPLCKNFGSYESCTVVKHINKCHAGDASNVVPISNIDIYRDEIEELQRKCFPNRPMKLIKKVPVLSKPRERHQCKICDYQVAQSDRQRHVYHRHLAKDRIFECPLCDFSSNYDLHRVKWHIKWIHKEDGQGLEPVSHESLYREEIDQLNEQSFPGWQHRKRPYWWIESSSSPTKDEPETFASLQKKVKLEVEAAGQVVLTKLPSDITEWTCQVCFKEFKPSSNFLRHVAKDHLSFPLYQCSICLGYGGQDSYEIRSHMMKVHNDHTSEPKSNIEGNAEEIQSMYNKCFPGRKFRLEKRGMDVEKIAAIDDVKIKCRECEMEMKLDDRQVHVYRHHLKEAKLYQCPHCDFSHHACSSEVKNHLKYLHPDKPNSNPMYNLTKFGKQISEWNERCFPGWINRRLPTNSIEDFNLCRLCNEEVRQTSRHIAEKHLNIPLHQCPLCEYGAAESRLVVRHMKNQHKAEDVNELVPIANVVQRRQEFSNIHDVCFPGRPKRLTHITISDEGRRTKCKQCGLTVSKKKRLSHMLEFHVNIVSYRCVFCDFSHSFDRISVDYHMREAHRDAVEGEVHAYEEYKNHLPELEDCGKLCFNDSAFDMD